MKRLDLSGFSFLVIDDSVHMRKIIRTLLSGFGVRRLNDVESGEAALQSVVNLSPDIILCDWEMPGMSGLEFVKKLRTALDTEVRFIPVIFISGHSELSRVEQARDAGVNNFLVKPISASGLYNHITSVVLEDAHFVESENYFGPDRRRSCDANYQGEDRRDAGSPRDVGDE